MDAFTEEKVVPEIIDSVPPSCLKVTYGGTALSPGDELTPIQVKDVPTLEYAAVPDAYYTVICIDHDAPSRKDPNMADILHWLVINIQGSDVTNGNEVAQYIGSRPPKGSGLHRYVLLVCRQTRGELDDSKFQIIPNNSREGRSHLPTKKFLTQHGLDVEAGNFFQAQDDYVRVLHKIR